MTAFRPSFARLLGTGAALAALGLTVLVPSGTAGAATPPALPATTSAQAAASWLAGQIQPAGYIASSTNPGAANLDATANAVVALADAGVGHAKAVAALTYLEGQVNAYVSTGGSDGPGQLALLILDAESLGVDPTAFGGTDLVARLEATLQPSGLFGAQDATYDGAYRQGLALAALAAAGVTTGATVTSAESWLTAQQCPDGGWTSLVTTANPCTGKPAQYAGPDTNSTALAVEGLEAQGALAPAAASAAVHFLKKAQDADGGWGYEPNTSRTPGSTDPDSTALVLQGLLALGVPPQSAAFTRAGADGVSSLESDQVTTGSGSGGIAFPGIAGPNLLATYQAVPALAGVTLAGNLHAPSVSKVAPAKGPTTGGTTVRITGSGFAEATTVWFGAVPAASVTVVSGTTITAVAPAGAAGVVDVTVRSPQGTSSASTADHFTYK